MYKVKSFRQDFFQRGGRRLAVLISQPVQNRVAMINIVVDFYEQGCCFSILQSMASFVIDSVDRFKTKSAIA